MRVCSRVIPAGCFYLQPTNQTSVKEIVQQRPVRPQMTKESDLDDRRFG